MDFLDMFDYPFGLPFGYRRVKNPMYIEQPDDEFQNIIRECRIECEVKNGAASQRRAGRNMGETQGEYSNSWR